MTPTSQKQKRGQHAKPKTQRADKEVFAHYQRGTHEAIAKRAYEIWEEEGRPNGHDIAHWLEAEAQLSRMVRTKTRL